MATVRDLLARKGSDVLAVPASATALDAANLMNDRGVGSVVVTDVEGGGLVGIFTERDVMRRIVAARRDPATTLVRDVMTTPALTIPPETTLEQCRALVTERRIRHLPVVGPAGLLGLVTSGDVIAYEVSDQQATIRQLEMYVYSSR